MKSICVLIACCVSVELFAATEARDAKIIAAIRTMSAQALDPAQADVPLEQWLREITRNRNDFEWAIGGCDLKPTSDDLSEHPLCVEIRTRRQGGAGMRLHVLVGTFGAGATGTPVVHPQSFVWRWCTDCSWELALRECTVFGVDSLSRIAEAANALESKQRCR